MFRFKIIILFLISFAFFFICLVVFYQHNINKTRSHKDLSEMEIHTSNGRSKVKNLRFNSALIIFYVSSECVSCEEQLRILKNGKFEDRQILILSSEPIKTLSQNFKNKGITESSNIKFAHIDIFSFHSFLGSVNSPTTIITDRDYRVIKIYSGTTTIDTIKEALK